METRSFSVEPGIAWQAFLQTVVHNFIGPNQRWESLENAMKEAFEAGYSAGVKHGAR